MTFRYPMYILFMLYLADIAYSIDKKNCNSCSFNSYAGQECCECNNDSGDSTCCDSSLTYYDCDSCDCPLTTGAIILIVCGAMVFICAFGLSIYCCYRTGCRINDPLRPLSFINGALNATNK